MTTTSSNSRNNYKTSTSRHNHNFYAFRFFACEFLNLANVLFQIYFMDFFLDGEFTTYGTEVFKALFQRRPFFLSDDASLGFGHD